MFQEGYKYVLLTPGLLALAFHGLLALAFHGLLALAFHGFLALAFSYSPILSRTLPVFELGLAPLLVRCTARMPAGSSMGFWS